MLLRRLLLSAVSLAVAVLAVDLWFRARAPRGGAAAAPTYQPTAEQLERWTKRLERVRKLDSGEASRKNPALVVFSERYGWTSAEGVSGELNGDRIHLNNVGARGTHDVGERPPDGALRVACYGESFTFGTEVDDDEDWPARLEARSEGAFEVVNLAVMGWGTDQALLRFRDTQGELHPDVALLGLMAENIQRNVNRWVSVRAPNELLPMVKPRFVLEDGALTLLPQPYATEAEMLEAAVAGRLGVDLAEHEWLAEVDAGAGALDALKARAERAERAQWWLQWKQPDGEPFRVTLALLEAFHREALAGGVRFAGIVVFPSLTDLPDPERRLTLLLAELEERGIPALDLYDVVRARHARGEPTYGQMHLTAGANDEVAGAVLAWLRERLER